MGAGANSVAVGYIGSGASATTRTLYGTIGTLMPVAVELNGTPYTITALVALYSGSGTLDGFLVSFMEGQLGTTANLVFQLGGDSREIAFSSADRYDSALAAYLWIGVSPAFSWSGSDTVPVTLCVNE